MATLDPPPARHIAPSPTSQRLGLGVSFCLQLFPSVPSASTMGSCGVGDARNGSEVGWREISASATRFDWWSLRRCAVGVLRLRLRSGERSAIAGVECSVNALELTGP